MPELSIESDPALYHVEVEVGAEKVTLSALELSAAVVASGGTEKDTTPEQLVAAVRKVATPTDYVERLDDVKIFAIGARVSLAYKEAGNVPTS